MSDTTLAEAIALNRPLPVGAAGRKSNGWWGMMFLIMTEASLFAYLLFSYYYIAVQPHQVWLPGGRPDLTLGLPNTVLLVASSFVVWWGERGIDQGNKRRCVIGLAITILMGLVFVGVQVKEWQDKPFTLTTNPYASLYFVTTGFHVTHVLVGLLILAALTLWTALGYFDRARHAAVSIGIIYWHFVDVVWVAVFFTFYVTPYLGCCHG